MNPWWSEQTTVLIGAIGGSSVGVLGGLFGTLVGICAPRGRFKAFVIIMQVALTILGMVFLSAGLFGRFTGQPQHVVFPLILGGGILTCVLGCMLPMTVMVYRIAAARKADLSSSSAGDDPMGPVSGPALSPSVRRAILEMWGPTGGMRALSLRLLWPLVALLGGSIAGTVYGVINHQPFLDWSLLVLVTSVGASCLWLMLVQMRGLVTRLQVSADQQRLAAEEFRRA